MGARDALFGHVTDISSHSDKLPFLPYIWVCIYFTMFITKNDLKTYLWLHVCE